MGLITDKRKFTLNIGQISTSRKSTPLYFDYFVVSLSLRRCSTMQMMSQICSNDRFATINAATDS